MRHIISCSEYLKESIWADLQDRTSGEVTKKEDEITLKNIDDYDIDGLYKYLLDNYYFGKNKPEINDHINYYGEDDAKIIHIQFANNGAYLDIETFGHKLDMYYFSFGPDDYSYALDDDLQEQVMDPYAGEGPDDEDEEQCYLILPPTQDGFKNSDAINVLNQLIENL